MRVKNDDKALAGVSDGERRRATAIAASVPDSGRRSSSANVAMKVSLRCHLGGAGDARSATGLRGSAVCCEGPDAAMVKFL